VLERWIRLVIKRRVIVIAIWVVITILGVFSTSHLTDLLTTSLTVPGTSSAQANAILIRNFHENVEGTFTVVVPFTNATSPEITALEAKISTAATKIPTGTVSEERAVGGLLYANVNTSFNLGQAANATGALRSALRETGLSNALVTGPPALQHDITPVLKGDLRRGGPSHSFSPSCCSSPSWESAGGAHTFSRRRGDDRRHTQCRLSPRHHFLMVLYVPNVVELIGLALAIDYSLFIVHRFRTEVSRDNVKVDDAIVTTMHTAGKAVMFSGSPWRSD